jgi:hypothetical protein
MSLSVHVVVAECSDDTPIVHVFTNYDAALRTAASIALDRDVDGNVLDEDADARTATHEELEQVLETWNEGCEGGSEIAIEEREALDAPFWEAS